jgi:GH24 family phage-related lysozyme (muramidase)
MPDAVPASAPAAPVMLQSSDAAINLIVTEEDSGQAYYEKHYLHFDWPLGASGPTVGIGYDCGYSTADEIKADWTGYVDAATIAALMRAAGLKGTAAAQFVARNRSSVTITWDQAMAQFKGNELLQWEARVRHDLLNTNLLPGDCFGALTSIAYNRGDGGFHAPGARFLEMRAIADQMAAKQFDKIPAEILSMRRLWPDGGDLWRRRGHEAALFQQGLNGMKPPVPVA